MGRAKKRAWQLTRRPNSRLYQVEFRYNGKRYRESTGCDDPAAPATEAARIYAEVVSGRRRPHRPEQQRVASALPLDALFAEWLASLQGSLDETSVRNYEMYVRAHLLPYFLRLDRITTAACSDYTRMRLRKVQAITVRKEHSALRGFLAWCAEQGHLAEDALPQVKGIPKRATGTQSERYRKVGGWIGLKPEEAHAIIAYLPERGRGGRPVRAYFTLL